MKTLNLGSAAVDVAEYVRFLYPVSRGALPVRNSALEKNVRMDKAARRRAIAPRGGSARTFVLGNLGNGKENRAFLSHSLPNRKRNPRS